MLGLHHHRFYGGETERRKWQNPEATLADIGLHKGFTFVDVGCGDGFFAIPAARIVGKEGKVYALDFDEEAITSLKRKAARENLENIEAKTGAAEGIVLCEGCADIVFFGIVLHDFKIPRKVLANAKRMLKPTGRLVDLDWKKEPMNLGPPLQIRFSEGQAAKLIEEAGFKIDQKRDAGSFQYLIEAIP
jgi:ubiquinone/menaquinone biosynthesis C-methylase UbiE